MVQLVDDLSGQSIDDGEGRTIRFAFDGAEYEIDLSNSNIEEFSNSLERFVRASRRVSGRRKSGGTAVPSTSVRLNVQTNSGRPAKAPA